MAFEASYIPADTILITPDDDEDLPYKAIGVECVGAGDVTFITAGGTTRTRTVAAGDVILLQIRRVLATGTTATPLYGLRY